MSLRGASNQDDLQIAKNLAYTRGELCKKFMDDLIKHPIYKTAINYHNRGLDGIQKEDEFEKNIPAEHHFYILKISKIFALTLNKEKNLDREFIKIGNAFIEAASRGDIYTLNALMFCSFPVNYQHHKTGETALHVAAACNAKDIVVRISQLPDTNYLLRDMKGRLASEQAYLFGDNPAMSRFLKIKERKHAEKQGVKITIR